MEGRGEGVADDGAGHIHMVWREREGVGEGLEGGREGEADRDKEKN